MRESASRTVAILKAMSKKNSVNQLSNVVATLSNVNIYRVIKSSGTYCLREHRSVCPRIDITTVL